MMATSTPARKSPILRRVLKAGWHTVDLNGRYAKAAGGKNRPAFYDIDKTYPCLRLLDQNYAVIREELESVLAYKERIPRYHDIAESELYISGTIDPDKDWEGIYASIHGGRPQNQPGKMPADDRAPQRDSEHLPSFLLDPRPRQVHPCPLRRVPRLSSLPFGSACTQEHPPIYAC